MMRNKEESRIAKREIEVGGFGTVPHIVLIDRRAFMEMITRLKFDRESIPAVAKTSRVRGRRNFEGEIDEGTLFLSLSRSLCTRSMNFRSCCTASRQNSHPPHSSFLFPFGG